LKDTKLGLETLDLMGYDRQAVRIVINRADSHVGIGMSDVKAILGREADVLVPSERSIPRSITDGNPIVSSRPSSAATKAFRKLADLYMGDDTDRVPKVAEESVAAGRQRFHLRRA
jgi:pilus assembly protein CpaE